MLFDASALPLEENTRQTIEVVAEARRHGAHVEGEIEGVRGVEDGVGSDEEGEVVPIEEAVAFLEATGVDCFAPAIGTAHGVYTAEPILDPQRVTDLVERNPVPMVLHGGTGLGEDAFRDLIARGCAKVNISTALKVTYLDSTRAFLQANPRQAGPAEPLPRAARRREGDGRAAPAALRQRGQGLVRALIFDCDGVLADTERDGHLPAFNRTFAEAGLPVRWSEEEYADKLAHRRRQGADGQPARRPRSWRRTGSPRTPRASGSCWPGGTAARPRSTRRWWPRERCPPAPG